MSAVEKIWWHEAIARDVRLKPNTVRVGIIILSHRNGKTGACFPAIATITRAAGVTRRTVQRSLSELEALGFVETEYVANSSNNYTFRLPKGGDASDAGGVTSVMGGVTRATQTS